MNNSQIFKLIFKHDLRIDDLGSETRPASIRKTEFTLDDFMQPDPTYSEIHFSGTNLEEEHFGLSIMDAYPQILNAILDGIYNSPHFVGDDVPAELAERILKMDFNEVLIIPPSNPKHETAFAIKTADDMSFKTMLDSEHLILKKVAAPDGFDLKLYSRHNIYKYLFGTLKQLIPESFRFFSINGHKFRAERFFYFETWSLHRLPHGFEEVFPETFV